MFGTVASRHRHGEDRHAMRQAHHSDPRPRPGLCIDRRDRVHVVQLHGLLPFLSLRSRWWRSIGLLGKKATSPKGGRPLRALTVSADPWTSLKFIPQTGQSEMRAHQRRYPAWPPARGGSTAIPPMQCPLRRGGQRQPCRSPAPTRHQGQAGGASSRARSAPTAGRAIHGSPVDGLRKEKAAQGGRGSFARLLQALTGADGSRAVGPPPIARLITYLGGSPMPRSC